MVTPHIAGKMFTKWVEISEQKNAHHGHRELLVAHVKMSMMDSALKIKYKVKMELAMIMSHGLMMNLSMKVGNLMELSLDGWTLKEKWKTFKESLMKFH